MTHPARVVTDPDAARALRDTPWLGLYLTPTSPSDAARRAGMSANLMHHHVGRLVTLGLLEHVGRRGGRVLYALTSDTYHVDRRLLRADEAEGRTLREVSSAFVRAFERSDHLARGQDADFATFSFRRGGGHPAPPATGPAAEAYPAHLHVSTLRLSPERYRAFVRETYARLAALEHEERDVGSVTLAFVAFDADAHDPGVRGDAHEVSSFVPLAAPPRTP